jgi:hypothetical protein
MRLYVKKITFIAALIFCNTILYRFNYKIFELRGETPGSPAKKLAGFWGAGLFNRLSKMIFTMFAFKVFGLYMVCGLIYFFASLLTAPMGYQDERGFRYGW